VETFNPKASHSGEATRLTNIELPNPDSLDTSIEELQEKRTAELRRASRLETEAVGAELQAHFYERSAELLDRNIGALEAERKEAGPSDSALETATEEGRILSLARTASVNRAQAAEKRAAAAEFREAAETHEREAARLTQLIQRKAMSWLFDGQETA